jgi:copper chaperone/Cu+-exporting ATPase
MATSTPLQFDVPDMDGQSGARAITEALRRIDPNAHVVADLDTKRVIIGAQMNAGQAAEAIEAAGFKVKAAA